MKPLNGFEVSEFTDGDDRFEGHELPGTEHSVMTLAFVNDPKHPTFIARERMVSFLRSRLAPPPSAGA